MDNSTSSETITQSSVSTDPKNDIKPTPPPVNEIIRHLPRILAFIVLVIITFSLFGRDSKPQEDSESDTPRVMTTPSPTPTVDNQQLKAACEQKEGVWREKFNECESMPSDKGLDAQQCESLGGEFSGCDSACRHSKKKGAPCIAVCVKVCKF